MKFSNMVCESDYKEFFEDDVAKIDNMARTLIKIKKEFELAISKGDKAKLKSVAIALNLRGEWLSSIAETIKKEIAKA